MNMKVVGVLFGTNDGCHIVISGTFYTSTLMKMSHWDHGLLALMSSISMIGDFVVALHLVKSTFMKFLNYLAKMCYYSEREDKNSYFGKRRKIY